MHTHVNVRRNRVIIVLAFAGNEAGARILEFKEAGGRRQESGGRRQEAGGRRQEARAPADPGIRLCCESIKATIHYFLGAAGLCIPNSWLLSSELPS